MMVIRLKRGYIEFVEINEQMNEYLHTFYEDEVQKAENGNLIIDGKSSELYHILMHLARTFDIELK